jgi:hypothetical protein
MLRTGQPAIGAGQGGRLGGILPKNLFDAGPRFLVITVSGCPSVWQNR